MGELELVGLHEDGEHVVLAGPDGQRFRLRIDEPLRAAVRRDRPQLEQLRSEQAGALSPREIQARIRAGATAAEVAASSGLTVEAVRRYEGPVLAEREFVAEQARAARVGRDTGSPSLGDLVTDRLAARGVDVATLAWDAAREPSGPWLVLARFEVGGQEREARWTYDTSSRALVAQEDEARWLSETQLDEPVARRHLAAVRDVVFDLGRAPEGDETAAEADPTAALLDDLSSRRGQRQLLEVEDDGEDFEGFGPQRAFDLGHLEQRPAPGAHPHDADPAREAVVLTPGGPTTLATVPNPPTEPVPAESAVAGPAGERTAPATADRPRRKAPRAKVPSWDEIVFGAKPE